MAGYTIIEIKDLYIRILGKKGDGKMKKLLLAILAVMFIMSGTAMADPAATFGWDANSEPDLAGYRIYYTSVPGEYVFGGFASPNFLAEIAAAPNDQTACTYVKPNLSGPGFFFVATAFDTDGFESLPSNEINNLPPGILKNLRWEK